MGKMGYKVKIYHKYILLAALIALVISWPAVHGYTAAAFETDVITVVLDNNYPPYSFKSVDGSLQGITIDQWKLFEKKTGIRVELHGMEWSKALSGMRNNEFDVIDTISYNEDREKYFDYTKPYATIDTSIFISKSIQGIRRVEDLKGFVVGAKKGDNSIRMLKQHGIENIVEYENAEAVVKAASEQKLTIFAMGKPPALYYLHKYEFQNKFNDSTLLYTGSFYRAVREGNKELLDLLNNGFDKISASERKTIEERWYGYASIELYGTEFRDMLLIIGAAAFVIVSILILWNRALKKRVNEKTAELSIYIKALQDSEQNFRKLFEGAADAVLILDGETFVDCNSAAVKLYGYEKKEELFGLTPWDLSPERQPDGALSRTKALEAIERVRSDRKFVFEWWHKLSDGSVKPFEVILNSIILNNKQVIHVMIRDISDRKFLELKLQYLSYNDQLTGLYNRRFFEEELKRLDVSRNYPLSIIMADLNGLKLVNDSFGHSAGDELLKKFADAITKGCRADDIIARYGGDEFIVLLPQTDREKTAQIIDRIRCQMKTEKTGSIGLSVSFGFDTKESNEKTTSEMIKKAEDDMYSHKLVESAETKEKAMKEVFEILYGRNKNEEQHSQRVAELSVTIGEHLGFTADQLEELHNAALLHDIGKVSVKEVILNKKGKLDDDELAQLKKHPEKGYHILSSVNELAEIAEYVLAHHERWDGKGYPKGLKGEQIPLQARIIALVETYDAIMQKNGYNEAVNKKEIVEEMQSIAGSQLDPTLVGIFIDKVLARMPDSTIYN